MSLLDNAVQSMTIIGGGMTLELSFEGEKTLREVFNGNDLNVDPEVTYRDAATNHVVTPDTPVRNEQVVQAAKASTSG